MKYGINQKKLCVQVNSMGLSYEIQRKWKGILWTKR